MYEEVMPDAERAVLPVLYSVDQAAELLHTTPEWLRRRAARRAVPHRRLGRNAITFSRDDIDAIVAQAQRPALADADVPVGRRRRTRSNP